MEPDRLNPVTLITGAAANFGAGCARLMARRSAGGLILADQDEAALDKTADMLTQPPERVSTLAFEAGDERRWADAASFIQAHYGRLDYAIVNAVEPPSGELVDFARDRGGDLEALVLTLRTIMPLMRNNAQGGAIVATAPASVARAAAPGFVQLVQAAAREGAAHNIRINAIAPQAGDGRHWPEMPWLSDLAAEHGSDAAALEALAQAPVPLARCAAHADVSRLLLTLLSDACPLSGATLVVDGGYLI